MYALMNWTGYALRLYPFEIDMTFRKDPCDNEVVPAMPINPLSYLPRVLEKMKRFVYDRKENPSRKFVTSLSVLWAVHNVPGIRFRSGGPGTTGASAGKGRTERKGAAGRGE